MPTVQPVTTLNIDNNAFSVSDLSDRVQGLVNVYNEWNQNLADAQSKMAQVQAALNDLSRQIILQVKADQDAAAAAANDATAAAAAAASVAVDTSADDSADAPAPASNGNGSAPVTAKE